MSKRTYREEQIHKAIVNYLDLAYPNAWFKSDLAAGKQEGFKGLQSHKLTKKRGFPDLTIFANKMGIGSLYIELKIEGEELILSRSSAYNSAGEWNSDHIREQFEWIEYLNTITGNAATFAIGTDHAIKIIDAYMKSAPKSFQDLTIKSKTDALNYNYSKNPTKWKTAFNNILPEQYRMMQRGF